MAHTIAADFAAFDSWADLQAYIRGGGKVFYQAPMDYWPVPIKARVHKDGRIAVLPPSTDVDPFKADESHLSRFKRKPIGGAQ